jgi:sensory rhodopsin
MEEELIFQLGAVIFAFSSFVFLFFAEKKNLFGTEFFISFITTISYALMSIGIAITVTPHGQTIYWSRWLFYLVACPLLMYDVAKILKISKEVYPKIVMLTCLTMFNGFLASYIVTSSRWMFFVLSSVAFICLLYIIMQGKNNPNFPSIKPFIISGWCLFPLVFLLAPTGFEVLTTITSETLYLILDVITKLFFGFITFKMK